MEEALTYEVSKIETELTDALLKFVNTFLAFIHMRHYSTKCTSWTMENTDSVISHYSRENIYTLKTVLERGVSKNFSKMFSHSSLCVFIKPIIKFKKRKYYKKCEVNIGHA